MDTPRPHDETPDERPVHRFFALRRVDGFGLAQTVWGLACLIFVMQIGLLVIHLSVQWSGLRDSMGSFLAGMFVVQALQQTLTPVLVLLLIRLVIEACLRAPGFAQGPIAREPARPPE